ncbi:MAG: deoxyribose-phosphate aldolase [Winogradskyella sp.]|nr:deoxyribose-phosphate aldolase [Winogradskyella sp.]
MKYLYLVLFGLMLFNCKEEKQVVNLTADEIITKSIEKAGGKTFDNSVIRFDFRDKYYVARRDKGQFSLIRMFKDGNDSVFDLLTNSNFDRFINNSRVIIEDSLKSKFTASVNSVHYFSVLPYGLNAEAVNKTSLGEEQIKGKDYYKIKVTFSADGGGEDYKDVFVYWVNKESFNVDYLAYSYNEDDGVGTRFREAYNQRFVNGLRFVDYNNYKTENSNVELFDLGKAFEENKLKLLSKIELKNIEVELLNQ